MQGSPLTTRENSHCAFAAVAAPLLPRRHERERIGWALGLLLVVHLI
jgi:hypothetical protein